MLIYVVGMPEQKVFREKKDAGDNGTISTSNSGIVRKLHLHCKEFTN
jgi:hypothetical protein